MSFELLDSHGFEIKNSQAKTKVLIATTNGVQDETVWDGLENFEAVIDFLLTRSRASALLTGMYQRDHRDSVKKHFIISVNPIAANHRATIDSISLATKIEQLNQKIPVSSIIHIITSSHLIS